MQKIQCPDTNMCHDWGFEPAGYFDDRRQRSDIFFTTAHPVTQRTYASMFSDLFHVTTCQAVFLWWLTQRSVFNFQSRGGDLALCDEWEDVNYCPPSFFSHCFPTRVSLNNKGVVIWWQRQLASYVIPPPPAPLISSSLFFLSFCRLSVGAWLTFGRAGSEAQMEKYCSDGPEKYPALV